MLVIKKYDNICSATQAGYSCIKRIFIEEFLNVLHEIKEDKLKEMHLDEMHESVV